MTPSPDQLRLCAHLLEHPEVPWQHSRIGNVDKWDDAFSSKSCFMDAFDALKSNVSIRLRPDYQHSDPHFEREDGKYSREGLTLLILHNYDCDQYGVIDAESPEHLWFSRHGGYYKLSKATGEVETLKEAEF